MSPSLFLLLLCSFACVSTLAKAKQITHDVNSNKQKGTVRTSRSYPRYRDAFSLPDAVSEGGASVAETWVPAQQNQWAVSNGAQEELFYNRDPTQKTLQVLREEDNKVDRIDFSEAKRKSVGSTTSEQDGIPHEGILSSRKQTFEDLLGIYDPLRGRSSENEAFVEQFNLPVNSLDTFSNRRKTITLPSSSKNIITNDIRPHTNTNSVKSDSGNSASAGTLIHATVSSNIRSNNNTRSNGNSKRNIDQSKNNDSSSGSGSKSSNPPPASKRRRRDLPPNMADIPKPLSMPGLILAHGYPAEVHHVTTEDGYILQLHRIPGPRMVDASPKKKRRSGRSAEKMQAQRVLEDEQLRALLEGQDGNTVLSVENLLGMSDILNELYEGPEERDFPQDRKTFHRKTRFKRSDYRARMARNRHLIKTVDPMVLMQKRLARPSRYVRHPTRYVPVVKTPPPSQQSLKHQQPSVEVNAKRSISRATLGIDSHEAGHHLNTFVNSGSSQNDDKDREVKELIKQADCLDSSSSCKLKGSSSINSPTKSSSNNNKNIPNHNNTHKSANITKLSALKNGSPTKKKIVFIQHCLQCSSADFVLNDHNQALGFILADAGYDVWLGNFRGNQYSKRHTTLSPSNDNFWKFTVDDLARYDIPAMILYVLKVTKSDDLYYIGHSLGTMTFFMATSTNPVILSKIRLMIALAPSGYLDHMHGGLKFMVKSCQSFYRLMEAIGIGEVGGVLPWRGGFMSRLCKPESPLVGVCAAMLPALSGRNSGLHDEEYLPFLLANFPSGTSFRLMAQIGQIIGSDGICKFDFGNVAENMQHYGSNKPPHYPLEKITCPVAIMWAENDYIVTPLDVSRTARRLPNVVLNYKVPHPTFNHVDFLFADIARSLVYEPILKLLARY